MKWWFLVMALLFWGCPYQQGALQNRKGNTVSRPEIQATQQLAPGTCRVVARLQTIKTDYRGTGQEDPCARVPCRAVIVILKVEGCGSGVSRPLPTQQPVLAHFLPTLNPRIAFSGKSYSQIPPLRVGKTFRAVIEVPGDSPTGREVIQVRWYQIIAEGQENPNDM